MKELDAEDSERLWNSVALLESLRASDEALSELYSRRIASASKVYASYDLSAWTIYDSRVALSLAMLTRAWAREPLATQLLDAFRGPPARVGNRVAPGQRRLTASDHTRAGRAFFVASWLLEDVAARLRVKVPPPPGGDWELLHVEMVMFSLGASVTSWEPRAGSEAEDRLATQPMPPPGTVETAAKGAKKVAEKAWEKGGDPAKQAARKRLEKRRDKRAAIAYAEETGGLIAEATFPDSVRRWVIFKGEQPIQEYPRYNGDLGAAMAHHDRSRLELRTPSEFRGLTRARRGAREARRLLTGGHERLDAHSLKRMLDRLRDGDVDARRGAATKLGELGNTDACGPLISALGDSNPGVRSAAAQALGKLRDEHADDKLVTLLTDRNLGVRREAVIALAAIRGERSGAALTQVVADDGEKAEVRTHAAHGLGLLGAPDAVDPLIAALESGADRRGVAEAEFRAAAASALGALADQRATPALVAALKDRSPAVRASSAAALETVGDAGAVSELDELLLSETDHDVARAAHHALAGLRQSS